MTAGTNLTTIAPFTPSPSPISTVPAEVMLHIFGSLPPNALSAASQVCWQWLQFANDKKFTEERGYELCVPANAEIYAQRRAQALARLTEIENMGNARKDHFEPNPAIEVFDLDEFMQKFSATESPSSLCHLLDWAGVDDDFKTFYFPLVVEFFDHDLHDFPELKATKIFLSKMYTYFAQRKDKLELRNLKSRFKEVVDNVIVASTKPAHIISLLRLLMHDIVAEDSTLYEVRSPLGRIKGLASQVLFKHRRHLSKLIRMRDYKPVHYLADKLRTCSGGANHLRNTILCSAFHHYEIDEIVMDQRLSENFSEWPASEGGNLTPAATFLLLEAVGLVKEIQSSIRESK